jgi:rhamnosyltransferase
MKILVILAAFNGEKYIKEQIDSILAQKNVSLDIFIFDDVSSDNTINVIKSYNNDDRIKLIINPIATKSAANNFFNAIKEIPNETLASYNYISLSDQDDIWLPYKLKTATDCLLNLKASLYCSNLILWDEMGKSESIINRSHPQKKYDYLFESGSAGCTYVFTSAFCLELKKSIKTINYLQWKFFSHDWFIYFFARVNDYKVIVDNKANIKYRMHANNLHGFLNKKNFSASIERLKIIQSGWYDEHIKGFNQLVKQNSIESYIYLMYTKNYFTRIFIVAKYNFSLNRSFKKSIQFFIISALPLFKNTNK